MTVPEEPVIVGRLGGPYGIKGWVKVFSHTRPQNTLLDYDPWYIKDSDGWKVFEIEDLKQQSKGIVVKFSGVDDRDAALLFRNRDIAISKTQMAELPHGEYYWSDLTGLRVETIEGVELGIVDHLVETGANDVLVVKGDRERLIPFVLDQVVRSIELESGEMKVDWDPDF